jgi:hypothetical protein
MTQKAADERAVTLHLDVQADADSDCAVFRRAVGARHAS